MAIGKLRRFLFIALTCFCGTAAVKSQVIMIPEVQAAGVIIKQQVWSVMINNLSGMSRQVTLQVSITDLQASQPLLEATSNIFTLGTGSRRVSFKDLSPVNYSFAAAGFSADRQLNQPLPVGEYTICYRLTDMGNKTEVIATECVKILAEPLSPPQLILPEPAAVLLDKRPLLTWAPPAPVYMFTSLSYSIIVSQVLDKQSPEEAIQRNIPVMTTFATNTSVPYTASFTNLESGKTYAWQVAAMDGNRYGGKSEVWTFTVMPDSVKQIISNTSYTKLTRELSATAIVHQRILKMEYSNWLTDSVVSVSLKRRGENKKPFRFNVKIHGGQNFIEYDLNGKYKLEDGASYELELINSRKEKWYLRFESKNYF
ncbi:hypothetical protein LZZ85_05565 [Terrimonas sp. NA20]|uniref:Fibronectin type-III domain-containing protein n=1 Tax=Terrimonas ginsenosidimutans TaxID=2908004 RepID=A0ABS9KN42_9BACT|nr:hypothetical protein [Terrimonas ginsenosidimutans]MCG2613735.1 hypothetical protein [Terrimonas ginsenosidimutans]